MKYFDIREEELKNRVAQDYFSIYNCTKIIGNVDFCVRLRQSHQELFEIESLLWAEAKTGSSEINDSITQLILTIGKARTFDKYLPPSFLGAFDGEKIAFISYNEIHDVFYQSDFNWNVTPSQHFTPQFQFIRAKVSEILNKKALLYYFETDDLELKSFIKDNFILGKLGFTKIRIDKNNFIAIYNKWLKSVKPTIAVNWEIAKKKDIIDGDFYLADLLSTDNYSLKDNLFVLLKQDHYELDREIDEAGMFIQKRTEFSDNQIAHTQFWLRYERPPKQEYWDYIVNRRDLLVPQDIRERKGSFFTPQNWVGLSQQYMAEVLGEDWQQEYYVWDCAAGTGNLLHGLQNKYNIWASTLDKQDVEVMNDRIKNGANLLEDHVFQFDFLNDDFSKLPKLLQDIIADNEKRRKLIVYINPPYAEAGSTLKHQAKVSVSNETVVHKKYSSIVGPFAKRELYLQFLIRIYKEIDNCIIAHFSKLKHLQAPYFMIFRKNFQAELKKMFVVPADTFDNVKGKFPIGFMIWDTSQKKVFKEFDADVIDEDGNLLESKNIFSYENVKYINDWLRPTWSKSSKQLGYLTCNSNDFQHQNEVAIQIVKSNETSTFYKPITFENLIKSCIYFTVRISIKATWLNDRDQYLFPNENWEKDIEFQNNCLIYALFHSQNRISIKEGVNQWIPFTEFEVNSHEKFDNSFMSQFIKGKIKQEPSNDLFNSNVHRTSPLEFSMEAQAVYNAGRDLWIYYHSKPSCNVNAALYDIREFFQGRNEKGKMNNKSKDMEYMRLMTNLRKYLKLLEKKIEPKIYEYGFLRR